MNADPSTLRTRRRGFSMVEMIACVSIIGIIAFLAIPSITRMRNDSEQNLAISRAESLNLAMATFIQVAGRSQAALSWNAATATGKYDLIKPYLAYAENTVTLYMPEGYTLEFPASITEMKKAILKGPPGNIPY